MNLKREPSCTTYFLYCNTSIDDAIKIIFHLLEPNGGLRMAYLGPFLVLYCFVFVFVALITEGDIKKGAFFSRKFIVNTNRANNSISN